MASDYLCKVCRGHLSVNNSIVLAASSAKKSGGGLVLLNPIIGDYTISTHPEFKIKDGEEYIYTCPICHSQLNSAKYNHLVRIIMVDETKREYDIYFSGIAGQKCTYKIRGKKMEIKGPDARLYSKYFEVPEEDRKYL
jgi:hypothetical protein